MRSSIGATSFAEKYPISQTRKLIGKLESHEQLPKSPQRVDRLKSALEQEAQALYQRVKKSQEKKRRVEEMCENMEHKRAEMLEKIEQKERKTQKQLQQNEKTRHEKFKDHTERFKKIVSKNMQEEQRMLTTNFQKRKEFYETQSGSQTPSGMGLSSNKNTPKNGHLSQEIEGDLLNMINVKMKKAERNLNEHRKKTVDRMKEHDKKIEQVREKFYSHQEESEAVFSKLGTYLSRIENARALARQGRQNPQRKKQISERLEKLRKNLSMMENERQQRVKELNQKFDKPYGFKRPRSNNRTVDYKQIQEKNRMRLELQKQARSNMILQKHQDVSLQNRAYKKARSKLFDMFVTQGES